MARNYGYGRWAPYVPVAERRKKAEREMAKLQRKGRSVAPVTITGRAIASTFWGKAWCDNLEAYHDYANRLPRGRTYVRNGSVLDLQIAPSEVTAMVSGSSIYQVAIKIAAVPPTHWRSICRDCAGGIDSLVELLQGRLSKGVMERICRQDQGLFPKPSEIRFSCSCPDHASMCKHIAAVLYGVGARLDHEPELLFRLRAVDETDLVADLDVAESLAAMTPAAGKMLEEEDLSAVFGLEMAGAEVPTAVTGAPPKPKTAQTKKAAKPKKPGASVTPPPPKKKRGRSPKAAARLDDGPRQAASKRRAAAKPAPTVTKAMAKLNARKKASATRAKP